MVLPAALTNSQSQLEELGYSTFYKSKCKCGPSWVMDQASFLCV